MGNYGGVTGMGAGNHYQDMLDFAYLLTSNIEEKMSIKNEPYN